MSKKECIAMLLAGGQGSRLGALTSNVAKPAVSFGGKFRIIDFALSNRATCPSISSACSVELSDSEESFPFSKPSSSTSSSASSRSDASSSTRFFSSSVALFLIPSLRPHSSLVSRLSSVLLRSSRSAASVSFSFSMLSTKR